MPVLIDVSAFPHDCCNHGIEEMFAKAIGGGGDDGIWREAESPLIRTLVELFTQRGLLQIKGVQDELNAFIAGERYRKSARPVAPPGAMARWTRQEVGLMKLYLESLPPTDYLLDDWEMLIEYLAQRYMPDESARTYAEWTATKSTIMGKVQASMGEIAVSAATALMMAAPETEAGATALGLSKMEIGVIRYGRSRCADYILSLTESMRHGIKRVIINHQQQVFLGMPHVEAQADLQTMLFDLFSGLNRDWRRIALTEAVENSNQGFIAAQKPGTMVKRIESYHGACSFCRKIDGIELTVVKPDRRNKDPWTMVWPGKTNVGRSPAPMKRADGGMVARDPSEMYAPAAGVQHPHCRGMWVPIAKVKRAGDDKFTLWMDEMLKRPDELEEKDE